MKYKILAFTNPIKNKQRDFFYRYQLLFEKKEDSIIYQLLDVDFKTLPDESRGLTITQRSTNSMEIKSFFPGFKNYKNYKKGDGRTLFFLISHHFAQIFNLKKGDAIIIRATEEVTNRFYMNFLAEFGFKIDNDDNSGELDLEGSFPNFKIDLNKLVNRNNFFI
jgi:hypothetical protein